MVLYGLYGCRDPVMLVAFHSSPFSVPLLSDGASSPLRGFELDVDILYSDSSSLDYSRDARKWVTDNTDSLICRMMSLIKLAKQFGWYSTDF